MSFVIVYITCKNIVEAKKIAKELVKKKLIACANIVPKIESIFEWNGKLCIENEALLLGKTRKKNVKKIIKIIQLIHSYKVPCICFYEIIEGNKKFLEWIAKQTR